MNTLSDNPKRQDEKTSEEKSAEEKSSSGPIEVTFTDEERRRWADLIIKHQLPALKRLAQE